MKEVATTGNSQNTTKSWEEFTKQEPWKDQRLLGLKISPSCTKEEKIERDYSGFEMTESTFIILPIASSFFLGKYNKLKKLADN